MPRSATRGLSVLLVSAGALLSVAPLSFLATVAGVGVLARWIGLGSGGGNELVFVAAGVVALIAASTAVDLRLDGLDAWARTSTLRIASLWLPVVGGGLFVVDFCVRVLSYAAGPPRPLATGLAVVLLAVTVLVVARTAGAFRRGLARAGSGRGRQ